MLKHAVIFALSFSVAFGGGYLVFKEPKPSTDVAQNTSASQKEEKTVSNDAPKTASSTEGEIFTQRGCVTCHAISSLHIQGGATGPDLSKAYQEVQNKHGVPVEEFLKKPTSAVMSSVLGGKPLTDEERKAVLEALKLASEKSTN